MYSNIKSSSDLKTAIVKLEAKEALEKEELISNFNSFKESMKPMNLIKSTVSKVTSQQGVVGSIIKTSLGLGAGLISKNLFWGKSPSIFKRLAGTAVKLGVTGIVARNTDKIKYKGLKLLTSVLGKKHEKT
ncbi:hypothetical protein BH11BAC3_BH11BAC3_09510 [soil metagenome]